MAVRQLRNYQTKEMASFGLFLRTKLGISLLVVFCIALAARLYINFSSELLSGNGGYYPLQVRTLLERGALGFSDMPLLFYVNAGIVKLLSLIGFSLNDALILNTVKFMDAILFPLIVIPLYHLMKQQSPKLNTGLLLAISGYLLISFVPMTLLSSFQKNAFAILLMFCAISSWILYQELGRKKFLWLTIVFLLFTGLAHFGTFMFSMIFGIVFLFIRYRWKAALPVLIGSTICIALVFLFDPERAKRIGEFLAGTFSFSGIFHGPIVGQILKWLFYGFSAFLAIRFLKKRKEQFTPSQKAIIWSCIVVLLVVPLPVYDGQFASRLANFLFIPQCILLIYFGGHFRKRANRVLTTILLLISGVSLGFNLLHSPPQDIPDGALQELQPLEVLEPDETIIVARHNLEFWVAWTLKTKVCQESEFNASLHKKYKHVLILNQTKGVRPQHGEKGGMNPFKEPTVPENAVLMDSTSFFALYEVKQ